MPPRSLSVNYRGVWITSNRVLRTLTPKPAITVEEGLTVLGGMPDDKEVIQDILQETWESADDWLQA
ncbi:DinI family protein [Yersinia canariae]|uniref:DinI family protein n=1 Tax=Yersinia canariae TaxID=2607663 RepID=A0A857EXA3_9GAMM|nr:DinI family protein [Yersinia canariae]